MSAPKKKRPTYRNVVKAHRARQRKVRAQRAEAQPKPRFLHFMAASASCSILDQLLAWALFSMLRRPMHDAQFLRILVSNVAARCVSLTLNYALNHRLVFTVNVDDPDWQRSSRRESLPRFLVLSAVILALSTLGVFIAHTLFGVAEWQAKIAVDIALFFLNYNVQRKWVFRREVTVSVRR